MGKVIQSGIERRHHREIRGKEIWAQQEPTQEMIWDVCPYIRTKLDRCRHCPPWREDKHYGKVKDGCFMMAAEVCRIVFARQKRETKKR